MGFNSRFFQVSSSGPASSPGTSRGSASMSNQGPVSSPITDYAGVDIGGHYKYSWPSSGDTGTALTDSDRGTYFWLTGTVGGYKQIQVYYDGTVGTDYVFISVQPATGPNFFSPTLHDN